jgi:large subunit ribosomal protein L6
VSRIGKQPITIPKGTTVALEGQKVTVKGPKNVSLERMIHPALGVKVTDGQIRVERKGETRQDRALHGLTRALIANMIHGVNQGYRKSLEIMGVGYKTELRDKSLLFTLGFSHQVLLQPPPGIIFEVEKPTLFHISGADKELVGQVAAKARAIKPPDAYKGKGVRYLNEYVRLKAGKTAK